jgi:Rrf2 family nitric oxide-sensitive transcriptional repressor
VLIHLAAHPDGRSTIAATAAAFDVSENHLTKVVHFLGKQGFLTNVRGRGGGLELAREAKDINVAAVVRATEGSAMPAECFHASTNRCAITRACRLKHVLREAIEAFYAVLGRYTLEDLVHNRAALARVLFAHETTTGSRHSA